MAGNGISRCLQWRAKHDHVFSAFHPLKPLLRPSTLRKENRVIKLFVMSLSGKTPFLAFVHCSCCASPGELFHYLTAQQRPPYLCKNSGSLNPWNNRIGVFKFRMQQERQAPMLYKDFSYMETFLLLIQFFWSIEAFLLWRSVWTKLQATARLDTEAELWRAKIQFLHIRLFSCYISLPALKIRKAANPKKFEN